MSVHRGGRRGRSAVALNAVVAGRRNRALLLDVIQREGPVGRSQLARRTGLTAGTITNAVRDLVRLRLVRETGAFAPRAKRGAGAPSPLLGVDRDHHRVLSIHHGVSRILVGGHDLCGEVLASSELPAHPGEPAERTLERMAAAVRELAQGQGWGADRVRGVGVGAVGLVDVDAGAVRTAPNLGWERVPVRALLADRLGWPVVVGNNVHATARGEQRFARPLDGDGDWLYVHVGYGIGGALLSAEQVYLGAHGAAGEIGHLQVAGGGACTCGKTGCVETVAAERALAARARRLGGDWPGEDREAVAELVRRAPSRPDCAALLGDAAGALGQALGQVCEVFDPGVIIVGGAVAEAEASFLAPLAATLRRSAFALRGRDIAVRPGSFGARAGMIGAAAIALDAFVYSAGAALLVDGDRQS